MPGVECERKEKQQRENQCQSRILSIHWSKYPVAHGGPVLEQMGISEGLQPVERMHAGEGEKCVEEGLAEVFVLTSSFHPHPRGDWLARCSHVGQA